MIQGLEPWAELKAASMEQLVELGFIRLLF